MRGNGTTLDILEFIFATRHCLPVHRGKGPIIRPFDPACRDNYSSSAILPVAYLFFRDPAITIATPATTATIPNTGGSDTVF